MPPIPARGWIFCAGHMPSLTYLSTIRKYYSTSSTSSYICTHQHVGNSQKRHDIDRPKMEQERQMSPNVGPTFSDMSPTCCPTQQCRVKIANADIQQTQLRWGWWCNPPTPAPGSHPGGQGAKQVVPGLGRALGMAVFLN